MEEELGMVENTEKKHLQTVQDNNSFTI